MLRKIKILQIVDGFRLGGAEKKLLELVEHLDRDKYQITICNVGPTGPLKKDFEKLGLKLKNYPRRYKFDVFPFLKVFQLLQKEKIDIVQTTLFYADIIGAISAKLAGVPVVISWETISHERGNTFYDQKQHHIEYRLAMKCVDKIVAVSRETKASIMKQRKINEGKIKVIYYGVDLSKFQVNDSEVKRKELGLDKDIPIIGVIARLEEVKGHLYLLQAFTEIVKKYPEVKCILVGDGHYKKELQRKVQEMGLIDNFLFLGFRNDIPELLNIFNVFVLPSLSEGLPNVVLEAMACSKPVVATSVGGIPEVLVDRQNGLIVPPKDSRALAWAILTLLDDRELMKELGLRARESVESQFSLEKQVREFQDLYDRSYYEKTKREIRNTK